MLALALLGLFTGAALANSVHLSTLCPFDEWAKAYNRTYDSNDARAFRMSVFCRNYVAVAAAAATNTMLPHQYQIGTTQFFDLTDKEWTDRPGCYRPVDPLHLPSLTPGAPRENLEEEKEKEEKETVDYRTLGIVPPVRDQGDCGSCWSFAATALIESARALAVATKTVLSPQELVDCGWLTGNHGCDGGNVALALAYAQFVGLDNERTYPYTAHAGTCRFAEWAQKNRTRVRRWSAVPARDEDALVRAIATYGPVAVAIDASAPAFRFYRSGIFTDCPRSPVLNHAVLAVGYDRDSIILQNSWGESWGDQGFFRLPRRAGTATGTGACGITLSDSFYVLN
jgi:C1A family cysteine protease